MADLDALPHCLDDKKRTCRAVIETQKGSRNKIDYNPDSRLFMLDWVLPEGVVFPYDFGFIPSTLGEDGDPLDILVLADAPVHVGCLVDVRILGAIEAKQTEKGGHSERNDRLLGAAIPSHNYERLKTIDDLGEKVLGQLEEFFVTYNKERGKQSRGKGRRGPAQAVELVKEGIRARAKKG